jgi:sugar lactone lactonase YvrE
MKAAFFTLVVAVAIVLSPKAPAAGFTTNQSASVVLGQPDFTSTGSSNLPNRFAGPEGMAVDPTTGKVFVADTFNNRVLRFSSTAAAINGSNPEAVIGQASFASSLANQGGSAAANTLNFPSDVFVDSAGRLWVADYQNNRVLRFDLASLIGPTNPSADRVLGQALFTTAGAATTSQGMNGPFAITVDSNGVLWVADSGNNRVLRFDDAATKNSGAAANGVLGQALFTTSGAATSISKMNDPVSISTDSSGRLWVADNVNNRVLRFDAAASKADGANADGVLGQALFTTSVVATTATGMSLPYGVHADASGNLWVSEYGNQRAIRFSNAASLADGAAADLVLGQANLTSNTASVTAKGGGALVHIAGGPGGSLLVADLTNSRVLRYSPTSTPPSPEKPLLSLIGSARRSTTAASLHIRGLSGDSDGTVTLVQGRVVPAKFSNARGTSPWNFHARRLRKGVNRVLIRAIDNDGLVSDILRVTVIRRVPPAPAS